MAPKAMPSQLTDTGPSDQSTETDSVDRTERRRLWWEPLREGGAAGRLQTQRASAGLELAVLAGAAGAVGGGGALGGWVLENTKG